MQICCSIGSLLGPSRTAAPEVMAYCFPLGYSECREAAFSVVWLLCWGLNTQRPQLAFVCCAWKGCSCPLHGGLMIPPQNRESMCVLGRRSLKYLQILNIFCAHCCFTWAPLAFKTYPSNWTESWLLFFCPVFTNFFQFYSRVTHHTFTFTVFPRELTYDLEGVLYLWCPSISVTPVLWSPIGHHFLGSPNLFICT